MLGSVMVVTPPDDLLEDSSRILCIDLDQIQTGMISKCLSNIDFSRNIVIYMWKSNDSYEWLADKKEKADLVIFNANMNNVLVGYLAGLKNSFYFGNLKDIDKFNTRCIFDLDTLIDILQKVIE
jgi:hypothetical protein